MNIVRFLMALALVATLLPPPIPAEDEPKEPAEKEVEDKRAELRFKFMHAALARYEIEVGEDRTPAKLLPAPLLRWSNAVSDTKDGIVGLFTAGGRPAAIAQFAFHSKDFQVHEFYSTTSDDFEMKRREQSIWKPAKPVFAFQDVKDGPVPAKTEKLRLPQMRKIAARFTVVDDFGWDKKEKHNLRLMTQPLHRYKDEARKIVDGAIFAYTLGTDPEAVMLLELVGEDDALRWKFGFSPMSIYALTATHEGEEVWSIEERKIFNSYDTPFRVGPYPAEPGETVPD